MGRRCWRSGERLQRSASTPRWCARCGARTTGGRSCTARRSPSGWKTRAGPTSRSRATPGCCCPGCCWPNCPGSDVRSPERRRRSGMQSLEKGHGTLGLRWKDSPVLSLRWLRALKLSKGFCDLPY